MKIQGEGTMAAISISKKKLKKVAQRQQSLQKQSEASRRQLKKQAREAKLAKFRGDEAAMPVEQLGSGTILGSVESHLMWLA